MCKLEKLGKAVLLHPDSPSRPAPRQRFCINVMNTPDQVTVVSPSGKGRPSSLTVHSDFPKYMSVLQMTRAEVIFHHVRQEPH